MSFIHFFPYILLSMRSKYFPKNVVFPVRKYFCEIFSSINSLQSKPSLLGNMGPMVLFLLLFVPSLMKSANGLGNYRCKCLLNKDIMSTYFSVILLN